MTGVSYMLPMVVAGGMLASTVGAGFLGGLLAGFIADYLTKFLNDMIKLPTFWAYPLLPKGRPS